MVMGSAAVDITSQASDGSLALGRQSTSPGRVTTSLGGVGRNISEAAHRILASSSSSLSHATLLLSPVGNDGFGRLIAEESGRLGMRTDGLLSMPSQRSAVCNMILDGVGNLIGGVADMGIIESLPVETVSSFPSTLCTS